MEDISNLPPQIATTIFPLAVDLLCITSFPLQFLGLRSNDLDMMVVAEVLRREAGQSFRTHSCVISRTFEKIFLYIVAVLAGLKSM